MSNELKEKESSEDDLIAKTILEHCGIDIKEMKIIEALKSTRRNDENEVTVDCGDRWIAWINGQWVVSENGNLIDLYVGESEDEAIHVLLTNN